MAANTQVLCMGNAIVDIIARVEDGFLEKHERIKGSMMLVDAETSARIYGDMPPAIERSGGSAGNTAAGIASFGGRTGYIGKVHNDQLGTVFAHDIRAAGVSFETKPSTEGAPTATSMILVSPDAQRTMNTFLGACTELTPTDVDEAVVTAAEVVYVEGYLWDTAPMKASVLRAFEIAAGADTKISLSLSDSFCVDRFREEFLELVENQVDILFANEAEIKALYQVDSFEAAVEKVRAIGKLAALTRGDKGSVVVNAGTIVAVDAAEAHVEDTTGAGDLYAAGFLYGYTNGHNMKECAQLGGLAAAEVISHLGARPEVSLLELKRQKLGL